LIYLLGGILPSQEIIIENLQEKKFDKNSLIYILKAKQKKIYPKRLKKIHLFNRKKQMAKSVYYTNGTFYKKNIKVDFKKGYFLEGVFYMQDCFAHQKDSTIKAKEAKYKYPNIEFSKVLLKRKNKIFHKIRYKVLTD
jgi:hypothetical protein